MLSLRVKAGPKISTFLFFSNFCNISRGMNGTPDNSRWDYSGKLTLQRDDMLFLNLFSCEWQFHWWCYKSNQSALLVILCSQNEEHSHGLFLLRTQSKSHPMHTATKLFTSSTIKESSRLCFCRGVSSFRWLT